MHVLALCAGIGGLELGLKLATGNASRTVCICEGEAYCASVLRARMQDGSLDDCPIWSDVRTFDPEPWRGKVDCITAGYPCQPFSHAGRRKGAEDPRHLWPHIAAHVRVLRPRYVFCENVPGHSTLGFEQVCEDLCGMGYSIEAGIFSAEEVGAPHLRKRLFFLSHLADASRGPICQQRRGRERARGQGAIQPARDGKDRRLANAAHADGSAVRHAESAYRTCGVQAQPSDDGKQGHVAAPDGCGCRIHPDGGAAERGLGQPATGSAHLVDHFARGWPIDWEHGVPRVATRQPHRIDRLRALGNAVVPQTAALAWTTLMQQAADRAG